MKQYGSLSYAGSITQSSFYVHISITIVYIWDKKIIV